MFIFSDDFFFPVDETKYHKPHSVLDFISGLIK